MKHTSVLSALGLSVLLAACSSEEPSAPEGSAPADPEAVEQASSDNPFLSESTLPFGLPPFDRIQNEHFTPAMERGMALQIEEVEAIVNNSEAPTFDNTLVPLEQSGKDLTRVLRVFYNVTSSNTNEALQEVERDMAPRLAAHDDAISLNPALFERLDHIYQQREELNLDPESLRVLERYHMDFVRAGATLSEEQKERLREINGELARLTTLFDQNVLAEVNDSAVVIGSREELDGMPEAEQQSATHEATVRGLAGQFVVALTNTSSQPVLTTLNNREVRQRIHEASVNRGSRGNEYDNTQVVSDILKLRSERARMLGYETHADYVLADQTAGTVEAVNEMLAGMTPVAVANAREEGRLITDMIGSVETQPFEVQAWDWPYYAEQVRREQYAFDEAEVRPYFEMQNVLVNGVFFAAQQLYGVQFAERTDLPTYHEDVQVWEAVDENGNALGLVLTDFYARQSKRGGAWMNSYNVASGLTGGDKVIAMHLNVTRPPIGEPTLLTFEEVTTMFHEFGHVLHGLFSDVQYPRFAGTNVPRDFVEFPSQVNEMWAVWPNVLENYALHHETGERIPQDLLDRVVAAEQFNQGYETTEYLAASVLDQALHQLAPSDIPEGSEMMAFENEVLTAAGFNYPPVPPRYRTPYFSHIMGGYSAGYYSYIWSEVLDADTVEWFRQNGGLTRQNGDRFREALLSRGGSVDAMTLYREFAGRDPDMVHMLRRRGLADQVEP